MPIAVLGIVVFPFHLKSFVMTLAAGAIYAASLLWKAGRKEQADAARFLAIVIAGALCLHAAGSYPEIAPHSSYSTFAAFAIAAAIGAGAAIGFGRIGKHP